MGRVGAWRPGDGGTMTTEFLVAPAASEVAGRKLLGLGLDERAGKMLAFAGLAQADSPAGHGALVLYPGELVGPMGFGAQVRDAAAAGTDEVVAVTVGGAPRPVLVVGPTARTRLAARDVDAAYREAGSLATRTVQKPGPAVAAVDRASRKVARDMLLASLRKSIDGLVSRTLNRPVSIRMSSVLAYTPLTPNMLSVLTFVLALAAAALMANTWFVAGALLMHFASILDGCDGEVARLKYQTSKLGGWLDTIFDDVSNSTFAVATGFGLFRLFGGDLWGRGLLGLALAGLLMVIPAVAVTYYRMLHGAGSDSGSLDWETGNEGSPVRRFIVRYLAPLVKRDAYLLLFLGFALVGAPYLIVAFYFLGGSIASVTMLTTFFQREPVAGAQPQPAPVARVVSPRA